MNNYNKILIVGIVLVVLAFLASGEKFCNIVGIDHNDIVSFIFSLTFIYILIAITLLYIILERFRLEKFDVVLNNNLKNDPRVINLNDFFKFVEYYQIIDIDTRDKNMAASCVVESESSQVRNDILNILQHLEMIVNANNKDNFYSRFIVMKIGHNLDYTYQNYIRKLNYDELVKNKISKEFTFMPSNEYDTYYPKPSIDSENQYPLPMSINLHNYYFNKNIEINLLALQKLIELSYYNDHNVFGQLIRPTEHTAFQYELMIPLKSIRRSMYRISNTQIYKEYLNKQRYRINF